LIFLLTYLLIYLLTSPNLALAIILL